MKFVGEYPKEVKKLLIASLVSGINTVIISEPGWGKTEMALTTAQNVAPDGTVFIELDPSTPPETIKGTYDPAKMLDGKLERIITGTPYDPQAKIVILDEVWRANDVVFDALIHATAPKLVSPLERPIFWGTANWVNKSERNAALRDRFGLYMFLEGDLNAEEIVSEQLKNGMWDISWADDVPRWDECIKIRKEKPTKRSEDAVRAIVSTLVAEASKPADEKIMRPRFTVNPRRVGQWSEILFRLSVYYTGRANFDDASQAAEMLKYAYPILDKKTARDWHEITVSIANSFGSILDAIVQQCEMRAFEISSGSQSGTETVTKIANIIREALSNAKKACGDFNLTDKDPRYKNAEKRLNKVMSKSLRGE